MRIPQLAAVVIVAGLALTACASPAENEAAAVSSPSATEEMEEHMDDETAASEDAEAMLPGAYLTVDEYQSEMESRADTAVVYFFHADWCPSCRATEESLTADGVPAGLTVVKVDFDTANDLKREYGITQQHTFVQVGSDGAELGKWTGSITGEEIKAQATHG